MSALLHLDVTGSTPPGKFRYTFREDGIRVECFSYEGWLSKVRAHYQQNGYAMPANWKELAEDQLCRLLPVGMCKYPDGTLPAFIVNSGFTLDDAIRGTRSLNAWRQSGFELVSKTEAERRGAICAGCYANIRVPGCSVCVGFANIVAEVIGAETLSCDANLETKACAYCKCASKAHVWAPVEVLSAGLTDEILNAMPEDWCWKREQVMEYRNALAQSAET